MSETRSSLAAAPPAGLLAQHLDRLRAALAEAPFDVFVAGSPANVAHATGYRSVAGELFRAHQMAAVVTPDDVVLVCPVADAAPAADAGMAADTIVHYGRFFFEVADGSGLSAPPVDQHGDLAAALATALGRIGATARLGLDIEGLGASWPAVEAALPPGSVVVDASAWAKQVRARKLPAEVELLRQAARLAEEGIDRAILKAGPGITERELAAEVAHAMVAGGGSPRFVVVTSGPRSALADATPTDRQLAGGDLLRFDVGCVLHGYWSDIGRTAVVGDPDQLQQRRYEAIYAGEQAQLELVRPGVTARELFDVAVETVETHGLAPYRRHHCGHGIGREVYEPPIIAPSYDTPLEPGMTFCFETPFYELGWGGMMVEDTLVVTEDGCQMLSSSDRSLRVVPW
ncbi:M24 family metallopeptidase [Egicoccus sp. AB-alg6-2]|uniref:M24 family metallopeptidase n=1 Tax=Egicoccus sp. AB-alg6-2 TaxID=3242692 RepID=UPI00359D7A7C